MPTGSNILVVDVGGTHIKALASGMKTPVKIVSGPSFTATDMVREVKTALKDRAYHAVSIGYPGPVVQGHPLREPYNLGGGWVGFDFRKAFGRPVKLINDAAMQALGSYEGGRMLFLGLGTGLGSAMIVDGVLQPMELAHLPYERGKTYEDYLGLRGLKRLGRKKWERKVHKVVNELREALVADYVVLGGGNVKKLKQLPDDTRLGSNGNAFVGGFRLWEKPSAKPAKVSGAKASAKVLRTNEPGKVSRSKTPAKVSRGKAAGKAAAQPAPAKAADKVPTPIPVKTGS